MKSILNGITRKGITEIKSPNAHAPMGMRNRVIVERHTPDGKGGSKLAQRVVQKGNIMCSAGLDRLNNLLATGTNTFTGTALADWTQTGAIGTDDTLPTFNDTILGASTATVHLSLTNMTRSDAGARTLEYQMTFDDGLAYTVKEVGLFASNDGAGVCIAHSTLAASDQIIKGVSDTINISHQIILSSV